MDNKRINDFQFRNNNDLREALIGAVDDLSTDGIAPLPPVEIVLQDEWKSDFSGPPQRIEHRPSLIGPLLGSVAIGLIAGAAEVAARHGGVDFVFHHVQPLLYLVGTISENPIEFAVTTLTGFGVSLWGINQLTPTHH